MYLNLQLQNVGVASGATLSHVYCDMAKGKVLSIQSHVVHGYVGNTAATFPLQVGLQERYTHLILPRVLVIRL